MGCTRQRMVSGTGERGKSKGIYLGLDVADGVVFGNVEHQVLDALRKAHHQLAWWDRTTRIENILWDGICTLLAFGFLAEGLHVLQVIKTRFRVNLNDKVHYVIQGRRNPRITSVSDEFFGGVGVLTKRDTVGHVRPPSTILNGREVEPLPYRWKERQRDAWGCSSDSLLRVKSAERTPTGDCASIAQSHTNQ